MFRIMLILALLLPTSAFAVTRYIDDTGGTDTGDCTSPCATFNFVIPKLMPGDTLIVNNGTYTAANSGLPVINCSGTANNGTVGSGVITVQAANERQALIHDNTTGNSQALDVLNCQYWTFVGLRLKGGDKANNPIYGGALFVNNSSNIIFRRNIFSHTNRVGNVHLVALWSSTAVTFEENELLERHRHGFAVNQATGTIFRRNYCNGRGYAAEGDPTGTRNEVLLGPVGLDACFSLYPAASTIVENNISEDDGWFAEINANGDMVATGNRFYGNISLNNLFGFKPNSRGPSAIEQLVDTTFENNVVVNAQSSQGVQSASTRNTVLRNNSFLDGASHGVYADDLWAQSQTVSIFIDSTLVSGNAGDGFIFTGQDSSLVEFSNAFGNDGTAFNVPTQSMNTTTDPALGTCKAWIPLASPMKAAGKNGTDKGANVLYRYTNGVLTTETLWNVSTGAFPQGVVITGVNDAATFPGAVLEDIQNRLNINTGGCSFPAGYGGAGSGTITVVWPYPANSVFQRPTAATMSIQWSSTDITGVVDIDYSTNGGTTWNFIASPAYNSSPYLFDADAFKVPATSALLIRVSQGAVQDISDSTAIIRGRWVK